MKILGTLKQVISNRDNSKFYYLYPIYEVLNDQTLRAIDRYKEFPNKGTVFIVNAPESIEKWLKKVIIVDCDIAENPNYTFKKDDIKACKFSIFDKGGLRIPASNEIIELISLDGSLPIEEIIENDQYRFINTRVLPLSSKILLSIGDFVYGCFEYAEDQKNLEGDMQQIKLITRENTNGFPKYCIKKYMKKDIIPFVNFAEIFISMDEYAKIDSEKKQFIYNVNVLEKITAVETIDFVEDKNLINMFQRLLNDTKRYEITNKQAREIKDVISELQDMDFVEERQARLTKLIGKTDQLLEYKGILLRDFFQTDDGKRYKKEYLGLEENKDLLREIAEEVEGYGKIQAETQELEKEKSILGNEVKTLRKRIDKLKEEVEKKKMKELQDVVSEKETQIQELDRLLVEKNAQFEEISNKLSFADDFEKAKEKREILKKDIETFNRQKTEVSDELNLLTTQYNKFERKIFEEALKRRNTDFAKSVLDILTSSSSDKMRNSEVQKGKFKYTDIREKLDSTMSVDEIIHRFETMFESSNRKIEHSDIFNYLICITQKFMTVFAGDPGVGKTSLCVLLAKCLGVYDERFLQISVERGWTSFKDLVGYYNPLSRLIEKSPTGVFDVLEIVNHEFKNNISIPYILLLDEANLSSIEHYWSKFLLYCDSTDLHKNALQINEDNTFILTYGVKFLATINFDHTTETLSDRFIDRSWIIMIDPPDFNNIIEYEAGEIKNADTIISFETLERYFKPGKEDVLNSSIVNAFKSFNQVLLNNRTYISARSIAAIKNYCIVAQKYMEGVFEPLDFAISQKILPLFNGYGDEYKNMLNQLISICDKYELIRCSKILKRIIERGEAEHGYYQFFSNR